MPNMFYDCRSLTSLDLSNFDTSNVTNMTYMFYDCRSLTSLDLSSFDTSNVTNMANMFMTCSNLTSLDLSSFDTSNVTNMTSMFNNCSSLTSLDLGDFNTSKVTNMTNMFNNCSNLKTIIGNINGILVSLDLRYLPLDNISAMVFINGLANVKSTKQITFKSITYDTLSSEQIAIATSKGWSVVRGS